MKLSDLPTLAEQGRRAVPKPRPKALDKLAQKKARDWRDREFRADVWLLDNGKCRACGRRCVRTLDIQTNRGEVHHLRGRVGSLRHDVRYAVLLCAVDHARLKDAHGLRQVGTTRDTVKFVEASR